MPSKPAAVHACFHPQWAIPIPLPLRHNERHGVSNHRRLDCLLNRLFRRRSKITTKLRVIGLCEGNQPATSEFPAQRVRKCFSLMMSSWRHPNIDCYEASILIDRRCTISYGCCGSAVRSHTNTRTLYASMLTISHVNTLNHVTNHVTNYRNVVLCVMVFKQ